MRGRFRHIWSWFRKPNAKVAAGSLLLIGASIAGLGWASFSAFLNHSNSLGFCISCHEMRAYVYEEYRQSPHYLNASGVRAVCADCHVPKALGPKLWRKVIATFNEVPKHLIGTIDTREEFETKRLEFVGYVWDEMKANDSRECRGCHNREAMLLGDQKPRARGQHEEALASGETCIECHQGIAHVLPEAPEVPGQEPDQTEDFAL